MGRSATTNQLNLEWNVLWYNPNTRNIEPHNVFNNVTFRNECVLAAKKIDDEKEFKEEVRHALMYTYWCRCEYEVVISSFPPRKDTDASKIDIYDQIMLNFDKFASYCWENREPLRKYKTK